MAFVLSIFFFDGLYLIFYFFFKIKSEFLAFHDAYSFLFFFFLLLFFLVFEIFFFFFHSILVDFVGFLLDEKLILLALNIYYDSFPGRLIPGLWVILLEVLALAHGGTNLILWSSHLLFLFNLCLLAFQEFFEIILDFIGQIAQKVDSAFILYDRATLFLFEVKLDNILNDFYVLGFYFFWECEQLSMLLI